MAEQHPIGAILWGKATFGPLYTELCEGTGLLRVLIT
jgi:hypothetical protein